MNTQAQKGFTLIELMIVIAIIGILAAIAIPAYNDYIKKSRDGSCLSEVKGYANSAYTFAIDPTKASDDPAPTYVGSNCVIDTDHGLPAGATAADLDGRSITATPVSGTGKTITCDLANGATCSFN